MTEWIYAGAGVAVLVLVLWDVFITVFSTLGGGPFTSRWTRWIWRLLLRIHARRRIHRTLAIAGPMMLVLAILAWVALLAAGCYLLFSADPSAVIDSRSRLAVDGSERAHFVGVTVSSVGYGDFVPATWPWALLSAASAVLATMVLTTSLSYVLAVVAAAIARKALAEEVFAYGDDVAGFVRRLWLEGTPSFAETYLQGVLASLRRHTHNHLSYPILHYFHSERSSRSAPLAVLLFADACFVLGEALPRGRRPGSNLIDGMRAHVAMFVQMTAPEPGGDAAGDPASTEHLEADALRAQGIDCVEPAAIRAALNDYRPLRSQIVALCRQAGWQPGEARR